jgi:hypothetical protein
MAFIVNNLTCYIKTRKQRAHAIDGFSKFGVKYKRSYIPVVKANGAIYYCYNIIMSAYVGSGSIHLLSLVMTITYASIIIMLPCTTKDQDLEVVSKLKTSCGKLSIKRWGIQEETGYF